jgi:flagellar basal-body rod modification protein FlgD
MNSIALTSSLTQQAARASAYATSEPSSTSTTTDSTTITSADFLTLLVTQMKNQDPTQPTDPTQYVQQLVGVSSLEQLIDVNKQLTSLGGSTASTSSGATTEV